MIVFIIISTVIGIGEILLSWLIFGNLLHKFIKDTFYEPAFLLILSIIIPIITIFIFRNRTKDWQDGIRRDIRVSLQTGLIIAMILACCYMGPITFYGFIYRNVQM